MANKFQPNTTQTRWKIIQQLLIHILPRKCVPSKLEYLLGPPELKIEFL